MDVVDRDDDGWLDDPLYLERQPWRAVPEVAAVGSDVDLGQRIFLGQRLTTSRKTNTDRTGRVLSDLSRSVFRCVYARVAAAPPMWSVETDDLAAAALTVVTLRRPADADLEQGPVEVEWELGAHWRLTRDLVLTAADGARHQVVVDFLGPPGTRPGDDVTWVRSELYRPAL